MSEKLSPAQQTAQRLDILLKKIDGVIAGYMEHRKKWSEVDDL